MLDFVRVVRNWLGLGLGLGLENVVVITNYMCLKPMETSGLTMVILITHLTHIS